MTSGSCVFVGFGLLWLAANINLAMEGNQAEIKKKSQTEGAVCEFRLFKELLARRL